MNNITILDNPYIEGVVISTNGVGVSSKAAKINDDKKSFAVTKKDRLGANWEKNKPAITVAPPMEITSEPKDYSGLLQRIGITLVNHAKEAIKTGDRKLRTNAIVADKTRKISDSSPKVDVIPLPEEKVVPEPVAPIQTPQVEEPKEVRKPVSMEPTILSSRSDIHGRHEHTGEIPVDLVREAVRSNNPGLASSRMDRSMNELPEVKQETKAGDIDLYTSLMHNDPQDDISKQLQGAKKELSIEKEENRKIAEQYGEAVKELEALKHEYESKKKMKQERVKQELINTLNDIETVKKEKLERTSDLTSIRAEISRLRRNMEEENSLEEYRSFGRTA